MCGVPSEISGFWRVLKGLGGCGSCVFETGGRVEGRVAGSCGKKVPLIFSLGSLRNPRFQFSQSCYQPHKAPPKLYTNPIPSLNPP